MLKITMMAAAVCAGLLGSFAAQASDRFIVTAEPENKGELRSLAARAGGELMVEGSDFMAFRFKGNSLSQVKQKLNDHRIKHIEEDQVRTPIALFNDSTGNPMSVEVTPYALIQSQADQVHLNAGGLKKVCVIDSGIDGYHPDFQWDAITGDNDAGTGSWNAAGGPHGTHVAGTIAAMQNGFGVKGMAASTPLHIVKVFTASGWAYSSTLAYAAEKCAAAGAKIISMSLGGSGSSLTESNAFQKFSDNGGLVIAAAGNSGNTNRSYPAGYPSVMMVAANDANNQIASFSQYPSCTLNGVTQDGHCVEIAAGGVNVLSAYPVGTGSNGGNYGYMSGTSMATPAVSGIAALVWSNYPQCSGEQIRKALKLSALDAGLAGKDVRFGYGIAQAKAAADYLSVHGCETPVVINLSVSGTTTKGARNATIRWSGLPGDVADVYRNGSLLLSTPNDGNHVDRVPSKGTYTYKLCQSGRTDVCSIEKSVVFNK